MKKAAFAYLRVSGKGQLEGDGFTRQLAAIKKHATAQGIRIVRIFREEGVSGTKDLENRPALQQLLVALHSNGIRLVLVEKLDRLARDLMIQESIVADMKRNGFEIVSVSEPDMCSDDPSRVLIRQILGAFAQYERAMIVQKLRGARQRIRAKAGRCEGRKPYGTRSGEAEVIERMKKLRQQGTAVDTIAATLNAEGIKPRAGEQWYATSVYRILKAADAL
jgi:DNA invertase Pin-like site-specific DNA recombinase